MSRLRALDERTPLRVKLIMAMFALVALGLLASGAAGALVMRRYLVDQLDGQLRHSTEEMTRSVEHRDAQVRSDRDTEEQRNRPELTVAYYSCLFDSDGAVQGTPELRTPLSGDHSPPLLPVLDRARAATLAGTTFTVPATSGDEQWRVRIASTTDGRTVAVALSLEQIDHTIGKLVTVEFGVGALVLVSVVGLGYLAIRSSLRPLMRVEATAVAIAAGDLGLRVPPGHDRTEVGRLARSLNTMLAQIEAAFLDREASEAAARAASDAARVSAAEATASEVRMRRFVADAGHELRTPLTSIRGFAELLIRQMTVDPGAVTATTGRIQAAADRMTTLVEDLLLLARLDQQRPLRSRPVDLLALVADAVVEFQVTSPGHPVALRADGVDDTPPVVTGDEVRLRQVIANLLANAGVHTPAGTPVTVTVAAGAGVAVLTVADAGPGLTPEVAERVFERFYREDTSRTRASGGTGLGLSIVASLVEAHGGSVRVFPTPGGGASFEVVLRLA